MPIIGRISVGDGATFTPDVTDEGVLSWTNNKNLENPASVDIPQAVINRFQLAPIDSPAFTGDPTAPTPTAGDNSTKIATTEFVNTKAGDYLPLSGGTMTGEIIATTTPAIKRSVDNSYLGLAGGEDGAHSAYLALSGKGSGGSASGIFELFARNDSSSSVLVGKPDGTLTWDGNNVLTDETVGTVVSGSKTSSTSVTANTATEVTHISLTAGVWVVTGVIYIASADVTANKAYGVSISTGSASFAWQSNSSCMMTASASVNIKHAFTRIITLSATTNVYLCAYASTATTVSSGYIDAVRIK